MRIDFEQTGSKEIDVEFNDKPLHDVIWADDERGECLVFERHHWTGDLVSDPESPYYGHRTLLLKGSVKIIDRRSKPEASGGTVYDFEYPGMCSLKVSLARTASDSSVITVYAVDLTPIQSFFLENSSVTALVDAVLVLNDRLQIYAVGVERVGRGDAVLSTLKQALSCSVDPI